MNEDSSSKNFNLLYLSLGIIAIITFVPLFRTGFGCADDLQNYLIARWGNYMSDAGNSAKIAGRFYYYIVKPMNVLPYAFDNMFIIKLFQNIPLVLCFVLFARILFVLTRSKEISFLFLLLFLATSQISGYTSLFVTYPFYYTFSFSLLLVSFLLLLNYLDHKKKNRLVFAVVLYAVGLLFYETYLLFLIIIALTILYFNLKDKTPVLKTLWRSFLQFLPFFGVAIIYLLVYVIFRMYHPSYYDGTSFKTEGFKFSAFFSVLWNLSFTSFPLAVFESSRTFFTDQSELINGYSPVVLKIILNSRIEWIIKGFLVAFCGYILLTRIRKTDLKTLGLVTIISALLIFTPHIPLALTPKYTFYVSYGMIGYVTTFFSLFGVLLLLTFLLSFLMNLFNFSSFARGSIAILAVFAIFICSVLTDFSNYAIVKDIRSANLRFYAMDELMKSETFLSIPEGSLFYAKDMYENPSVDARNLTEQSFNWGFYIDNKTKKKYQVFRNENEFLEASKDTARPSYYFTFRQAAKSEDIALVFAQIKAPSEKDTLVRTITDKAWIQYYSPYKIFTVSYRCKEPSSLDKVPIRTNHVRDTVQPGQTIHITIFNTKKYNATTLFSIRAEFIDLKSILISNLVDPANLVVYL